MKQLPTAEEFFNENAGFLKYSSAQEFAECQILMIEFARLHVEQALTEASKTTTWREESTMQGCKISFVKSKILNSYPLKNIK
jgi:hypothetical protein